MASGHPNTSSTHPPPHPHPYPHPSSHPHHHDTSAPAISTSSSSTAGATTTTSISAPTNPIATTTANHSNHSTPHAITAAPTNAQIPYVRLMCSYGGRILPRPGDNLLRYVGGETRIVSFPRNASFSTLVSLLSSLSASQFTPKSPPTIKYQLPHEDLDSLISLCTDEDLINMLDELDRLNPTTKSPRLRLFLFPSSQSGSFGSVLSTGESNQWFLDALNSASPTAVGAVLERRRSEASLSMMSDQPDYLTGIDTGSERSPVNPDSDPTETVEIAEPAVPAQPQEATVQPAPAAAPPVYYVPQPMPVYYVPTPVPYMQPSMDGQGSMPVRGYVQMSMPFSRPVYYTKENEQFVGMGAGSFVYEQATAGTYDFYPPAAVYPPPQADAGKKPAGPGPDVRGISS